MSITIHAALRGNDNVIRNIGGPDLNVANGNFHTLFAAIGLPTSAAVGTIDVGIFADKLTHFCESGRKVTRAGQSGKLDGGAEFHDFGVREDQGNRYIDVLWEIVFFAWQQDAQLIAWA